MIARTRVETIGRCLPPESGKSCTLFYIREGDSVCIQSGHHDLTTPRYVGAAQRLRQLASAAFTGLLSEDGIAISMATPPAMAA